MRPTAWILVVLVLFLVGSYVTLFRSRANRVRYGLVVAKRVVPGYLLGPNGYNTRAGIMIGEYHAPCPDRHQLMLKQANGKQGWVDVGEADYKRVTVGTYWPS